MRRRYLKAVLILPGNVLGTVPALLLWAAAGTPWGGRLAAPDALWPWVGLAALGAGVFLGVWTMRLFAATGSGTPAPWDPVDRLVVAGPYAHVRNPMIAGVILALAGEALIAGAPALAIWTAVFAAANAAYLPLVEEPGLARRYGAPYRRYKANVPRWIPRITPWRAAAAE